MSSASSPFLESISSFMAVRRYSKRTIKSYSYWIKYFIVYNKKRHPQEMAAVEVERFLTFLAVEKNVSISTQKIALNALVFLYNRCWINHWATWQSSTARRSSATCRLY